MKYKFYVLIPALSVFMIILTNKALGQKKSKKLSQIELLLNEKNSRTSAQKKIDSQLLQAIRESEGKKIAPGVDLQPANVNADSRGNVKVDINADVTDLLIEKIKSLGGTVIYPSKEYHTIRAEINLSKLEKLAGSDEVKFIAPAAIPRFNSPVRPRPALR